MLRIVNCIVFEGVSCDTHYCIVRYSMYRDITVYRLIFFWGWVLVKEEGVKGGGAKVCNYKP